PRSCGKFLASAFRVGLGMPRRWGLWNSRPAGGVSMDRIRIRGGRGLSGSVRVSGSKNGALPILAASLLVDGPIRLTNVPRLTDVENLLRILGRLGVWHNWAEDGSLHMEAKDKTLYVAPYDLVRTMRASFVVLGPLWARRGVARVSYPGGCVF